MFQTVQLPASISDLHVELCLYLIFANVRAIQGEIYEWDYWVWILAVKLRNCSHLDSCLSNVDGNDLHRSQKSFMICFYSCSRAMGSYKVGVRAHFSHGVWLPSCELSVYDHKWRSVAGELRTRTRFPEQLYSFAGDVFASLLVLPSSINFIDPPEP